MTTNHTTELKPCMCGRPIDGLSITDAGQGGKWACAAGNCCGEWTIEFRTEYNTLESAKCMELAKAAWNNAPRDDELTRLRARVAQLEAEREAMAKQEPAAWEAVCFGPIYAREVFATKPEAEACADAWDHCAITPLFASPVPIPEGYALVPKEPTGPMIAAFNREFYKREHSFSQSDCYRAMLAAAPKPEAA